MNEQYITLVGKVCMPGTLVGKVCAPRYEEVYTPEVKSKLPIEATSEGRKLKDWGLYGNNNPNRIDETQDTLPYAMTAYGGNATDWEIYGNNNPVIETESNTLPIDISSSGGNAIDWVIEGNDDNGTENVLNINDMWIVAGQTTYSVNGQTLTVTGNWYVYMIIPVERNTNYYLGFNTVSSTTFQAVSVFGVLNGELNNTDAIANSKKVPFIMATGEREQIAVVFYSGFNTVGTSVYDNIMLIKGSTAPDHYIPYQQGVGERTVNLVEGIEQGSWSVTGFVKSNSTTRCRVGNIIDVVGSQQYTMYLECPSHNGLLNIQFKNDTGTSKGETGWQNVGASGSYTATVPSDATKATIILSLDSGSGKCSPANFQNVMFIQGSTSPSTYIPYGYTIPLKVTKHKSYPIQWALKGKAVRDQVTSTKGNETLTWDVIGIDHDECYYADGRRAAHSVTLQLHDCYNSLQFNNRQALFYVAEAMPAGTYHFTIKQQPWYVADIEKMFEFTLTQPLAVGSQICITNNYNASVTSGQVQTFANGNSTIVIESVSVTEGNGGTDLGEVKNTLTGENTNSIQRALVGSNNWAYSAMRQWLNSSATHGVWSAKTKFDRPPTWASNTAGFLNGMSEDFINAIGKTKKVTALNITDGGGTITTDEHVFLLSRTEVYGGNEVAGGEGTAYSYYSDYSDLSQAGTSDDSNRIKYQNNKAKYWVLRTPTGSFANVNRRVAPSGGIVTDFSANANAIALAVTIPMDEIYDCNEVDIYIGDSPLTEGETVSKSSTGVDIELFSGDNIIDTSLINKPQVDLTYRSSVLGVGERVDNRYRIPITVTGGNQSHTINIDLGSAPLTEGQSISKTSTGTEIALYQGENTISTTLGNKPEMKIDYLSTVVGVGERTENLWDKGCPVYNYSNDYKKYNSANAIELLAGTYRITSDVRVPILQAFDNNHNQIVPIKNAIESTGDVYYVAWDNYALLSTSASVTSAVIKLKVDAIITLASQSSGGHWIMITKGSTPPESYIPYGYQIPIDIKQGDEVIDHKDIYIGTQPLVEGASVSKASVGEDITLVSGKNYIDAVSFNKPEMYIK